MTAEAEAIPQACSQAEFARVLKCEKSYVTKLKNQRRLVFTPSGLVDVPASLALIKAGTVAPERAAPAVQGPAYTDAQDRDRHYSAELKRLQLERETGALLVAAEVLDAVTDAATRLRAGVEAWPARLAPQIAAMGGDEARIRALLTDHVQQALADLAHGFGAARGVGA